MSLSEGEKESTGESSREDCILESFCSICRSSVPQDTRSICLPCHHVFHSLCINTWFERHNTCPDCRSVTTQVQFNFTSASSFEIRDILEADDPEDHLDLRLGIVSVTEYVFLINMFPIPIVDIISTRTTAALMGRTTDGHEVRREVIQPMIALRLSSRQLLDAPDLFIRVEDRDFPLLTPLIELFSQQMQGTRQESMPRVEVGRQGSEADSNNTTRGTAGSDSTVSSASSASLVPLLEAQENVSEVSSTSISASRSSRQILMEEIRLSGWERNVSSDTPSNTASNTASSSEPRIIVIPSRPVTRQVRFRRRRQPLSQSNPANYSLDTSGTSQDDIPEVSPPLRQRRRRRSPIIRVQPYSLRGRRQVNIQSNPSVDSQRNHSSAHHSDQSVYEERGENET